MNRSRSAKTFGRGEPVFCVRAHKSVTSEPESPKNPTAGACDDVSQTIIVFDWDDTLCPSSWIRANRPSLSYFRPPPNEDRFIKPLEELQNLVVQLLEVAMTLGKVIIITNAQNPWISTSATNFMPKLNSVLCRVPQIYAQSTWGLWEAEAAKKRRQARKVNIGRNNAQSALTNFAITQNNTPHQQARLKKNDVPNSINRGNYVERLSQIGGKLFPLQTDLEDEDLSFLWKKLAFGVELSDFYSQYPMQSWSNVISIGDADYERAATKKVVSCCSPTSKKKRAKTIKMFDEPSIEELILQIKKLITILPLVVMHEEDIDIEIKDQDLIL
eukprot:GEMP01008782.1.p1 GENE.GEMP01008782.1~~GEMP01008782.1.p1  ORF type:complete len:329 (+),score=71.94 GEMP01008782.1:109-1095(+)